MLKNKSEFWDRHELYIRVAEKNIQFKGWQATLMTEFALSRAAMTKGGALDFVLAGGRAYVETDDVYQFMNDSLANGLLKYHYELRKTGQRMRIYKSSLEPDQFEYQVVIKETE